MNTVWKMATEDFPTIVEELENIILIAKPSSFTVLKLCIFCAKKNQNGHKIPKRT